jgi:hypothetical protein
VSEERLPSIHELQRDQREKALRLEASAAAAQEEAESVAAVLQREKADCREENIRLVREFIAKLSQLNVPVPPSYESTGSRRTSIYMYCGVKLSEQAMLCLFRARQKPLKKNRFKRLDPPVILQHSSEAVRTRRGW